MSETNRDSPPTGSNPPAIPAPPDEPAPLTVAPRAHPTSVYNPKDAAPAPAAAPAGVPAGAPAGFNEFMAWMQAFGSAQSAPPPAAPPAPAGRQVLAKEQKKFHRQTQESAKPDHPSAPGEASPTASGGVEATSPADGPAQTSTPPAPGTAPRTVPVIRKRRPQNVAQAPSRSLTFLIPWIILVTILAGTFLLGRVTAPRPAALSASAEQLRTAADRGEVNAQTLVVIDQAMEAESKHDFVRAADLFEQARREPNHITGLDYHLAMVAFEGGDLPRAVSTLDRSISEGEEMAAAYNLRGTLVNRQGGSSHGLTDLQTATQLDPFNAKYFFFYGEALRRIGKPQAALEALQKALDRLREPSLEGLYRLKVRLTQIELGQEKEFADEMARELKQPVPSVDWLCTAAALEMRAGRFDQAAGFLDRALASSERQQVEIRLHDFFFYGYSHEKALARYYTGAAPTPVPTPTPSGENNLPPPTTLPPDQVPPPSGPAHSTPP